MVKQRTKVERKTPFARRRRRNVNVVGRCFRVVEKEFDAVDFCVIVVDGRAVDWGKRDGMMDKKGHPTTPIIPRARTVDGVDVLM